MAIKFEEPRYAVIKVSSELPSKWILLLAMIFRLAIFVLLVLIALQPIMVTIFLLSILVLSIFSLHNFIGVRMENEIYILASKIP